MVGLTTDESGSAIDRETDEHLNYDRLWVAVYGEVVVGKGNTPYQAKRAAEELHGAWTDVFAQFKGANSLHG